MLKNLKRNMAIVLSSSMIATMINPCMASIYEPENPAVYEFGFEENPFDNGWTSVDKDGDAYEWYWQNGLPDYANSGDGIIYTQWANAEELNIDNILISPKITCDEDYAVSFYASAYKDVELSNYSCTFAVYAGASANIDEMTMITDGYVEAEEQYINYMYSLEDFANKDIYIAIRYTTTDPVFLLLDDFSVVNKLVKEREDNKKLLEEEEAKKVIRNDLFFEDFEADPFEKGWTQIDADGDGYSWYWYNDSENQFKTISGDGVICSRSFVNDTMSALEPDDYLISPKISLKDVENSSGCYLEINAVGQDKNYFKEVFAVYAGTSSNPSEMTQISDGDITTTAKYHKYRFCLDDFIGEESVYFAVRHYNVTDEFILNLDDIKVVEEKYRNKGDLVVDLSDGDVSIDCAQYSYKRTQNIIALLFAYVWSMSGEGKATTKDGVAYFDINKDGNDDFSIRTDDSNTYPVINIERLETCSAYGSSGYVANEDALDELKTMTEGIGYYSGIKVDLGQPKTTLNSSNTSIKVNNTYYATGNEINPDVTVEYDGTTLQKDVDYTITFSDNVAVGTGKIKVTGIGKYNGEVNSTFAIKEYKVATVDDIKITCYYDVNDHGVYSTITDGEQVEGITWNKENATLTLSGYNGGPIIINDDNSNGDIPKIKVIINGENTIDSNNDSHWRQVALFNFRGVDATITGNGTLTINGLEPNDEHFEDYNLDCFGNLTIDGATLILNNVYDSLYVSNAYRYFLNDNGTVGVKNLGGILTINSGNVIINNNTSNYEARITTHAICGEEIFLNGGNVYIKNHDTNPGESVKENTSGIIYSDKSITTGNVNIVIVNDEVYEEIKPIYSDDGEDTITIGDNTRITVLKSSEATIDKFNVSLSDTEYAYDGEDKKPEVVVEGLVEGIHYEVVYDEDTKSIGEKTVTIKGIGDFSGEITLKYSILEKVDNTGNKDDGKGKNDGTETLADGPKEGTTVKDKKYIYKVTKAGSTDGSVVGELEVVGLKKKSLKQIKIVAVVKIGGVSYKVTSVGAKAFKNNKKINKVFIGKNVKKIGANAFAGCKKLKQVSINSTVLRNIGKNAFKGDKKLVKVIIKSNKLKTIGKGAFKKINKKAKFFVPKAFFKTYKKMLNKKAGVTKSMKIKKK